MAKTRLSACMVLYHSGDAALKAVDCLEKSDLPVETYIVDNTPEDDLAQRISWSHPGVRVLPQKKNLGFGRANNMVLDELNSEYHLLINPDVTFDPDVLTRMVQYMDDHRNVVILTPKVLNQDGSEQFLPKKQPTVRYLISGKLERFGNYFKQQRAEYTMADEMIRKPMRVQFATGCFLLIRTEVFKKLGGFDERFFLYHEDSDLSRRAGEYGPIIYHPDMIVTHAWERGSSHNIKGLMRHIVSTVKFFKKWGVTW